MDEHGQSISLEYRKEASVCELGTVKGAENAQSQRAIS